MRSAELPYAPLAPGAMDGDLRAALAAVQRFRGDMEAAIAVEQGAKDHQYYEVGCWGLAYTRLGATCGIDADWRPDQTHIQGIDGDEREGCVRVAKPGR